MVIFGALFFRKLDTALMDGSIHVTTKREVTVESRDFPGFRETNDVRASTVNFTLTTNVVTFKQGTRKNCNCRIYGMLMPVQYLS